MEIKQTSNAKRGMLVIKTFIECPLNPPEAPMLFGKDKKMVLYKTQFMHLDAVAGIVNRFCEYNPHIDPRSLIIEFVVKPVEFEIVI